MNELGTLDELPEDYVAALRRQNLVPLWPSLRALLPADTPQARTTATHWPYASLRPLLMKAGELTPIEKAERRVLVLANPGHGHEKMQASAAIYLGMQLLLPGERAPAHRHTPNAVRMIVEGEGAYTTVNGERCPMARGDLILTPSGVWHEHGHDGDGPVVWLDVLDLPLVYYMEASYHVDGARQKVAPVSGGSVYGHGGIVPAPMFIRSNDPYPMLRYPWKQTRAALEALAQGDLGGAPVQVNFVNPSTGGDAQNILGYYALMLREGESVRLPARSPASVFHLVEGDVEVATTAQSFSLVEADTCCVPGYSAVHLANRSRTRPAFVFIVDEAPLHRKLGIFENRG